MLINKIVHLIDIITKLTALADHSKPTAKVCQLYHENDKSKYHTEPRCSKTNRAHLT